MAVVRPEATQFTIRFRGPSREPLTPSRAGETIGNRKVVLAPTTLSTGDAPVTNDAFLQAIFEAPEDPSLRLIYADWLQDQGQADRAEFLRVHCQLAMLVEGDPQWGDLEARAQQL